MHRDSVFDIACHRGFSEHFKNACHSKLLPFHTQFDILRKLILKLPKLLFSVFICKMPQ